MSRMFCFLAMLAKVPAEATSPSTSKSFAYSRKRTIDCTSSGSLRFSAGPLPAPPGMTSSGGKSDKMITRGLVAFASGLWCWRQFCGVRADRSDRRRELISSAFRAPRPLTRLPKICRARISPRNWRSRP